MIRNRYRAEYGSHAKSVADVQMKITFMASYLVS